MSIVVLLTLKAKPEAFDALKSTMRQILPDTKTFKGNLGILACADPAEHTLILYERWENAEAQQAYMAWRGESGDLDAMGAALREPPLFETREDVFS